jgi:hypothetical protein
MQKAIHVITFTPAVKLKSGIHYLLRQSGTPYRYYNWITPKVRLSHRSYQFAELICIIAQVSAQPLIIQKERDFPLRPLNNDCTDFDILRSWVSLCSAMHTQSCGFSTTTATNHLRVIDCYTRELVPAEDQSYAALSYTWGQNEKAPTYSKQLHETLPSTIEDAITVTLQLGCRYIWIDRYCIDQESKIEAHEQIQHMDSIYQNSLFTIIAAAGFGPSYGLPGISRPRSTPARVKIGQNYIVALGQSASKVVSSSPWASRGWTYQEAIFSRRRLVFTDEQVYYECHGMYCHESLNLSMQEMHDKTGQRLPYKATLRVTSVQDGIGFAPSDVFDRVAEFTRRTLTYPGDRLNAFAGVLKAFENKHNVHHLWGIPIFPQLLSHQEESVLGRTGGQYSVVLFLECLILWLRKNGRDGDRQTEFPSVSLMFSKFVDFIEYGVLKNLSSGNDIVNGVLTDLLFLEDLGGMLTFFSSSGLGLAGVATAPLISNPFTYSKGPKLESSSAMGQSWAGNNFMTGMRN